MLAIIWVLQKTILCDCFLCKITNYKLENDTYVIDNSINPDILMSGVNNYDNKLFSYGLMFVVVSIFLYTFIKSILRLRR